MSKTRTQSTAWHDLLHSLNVHCWLWIAAEWLMSDWRILYWRFPTHTAKSKAWTETAGIRELVSPMLIFFLTQKVKSTTCMGSTWNQRFQESSADLWLRFRQEGEQHVQELRLGLEKNHEPDSAPTCDFHRKEHKIDTIMERVIGDQKSQDPTDLNYKPEIRDPSIAKVSGWRQHASETPLIWIR